LVVRAAYVASLDTSVYTAATAHLITITVLIQLLN